MPEEQLWESYSDPKTTVIIQKENNIMTNAMSFGAGTLLGVSGLILAAVLSRKSEEIRVTTSDSKKEENEKK